MTASFTAHYIKLVNPQFLDSLRRRRGNRRVREHSNLLTVANLPSVITSVYKPNIRRDWPALCVFVSVLFEYVTSGQPISSPVPAFLLRLIAVRPRGGAIIFMGREKSGYESGLRHAGSRGKERRGTSFDSYLSQRLIASILLGIARPSFN